MLYTVFFILSLVALGGSIVVYFRFFTNGFSQHPSWPFQPAYIVGMGLFFVASWMILMPVYAYNTDMGRWQTIVSAFISALQEFTINLGAGDILKMADGKIGLQIYLSIFIIVSALCYLCSRTTLQKSA